ncbi:MAG: FkbM family methyltransferase [Cryomorphaceae bacterium]
MKARLKKTLQKLLGFDRYLFVFSVAVITTLRRNKNERDFLHFLKMIPDGGVVLDIGANIGIMSVWLGRRLKNSTILAYEPIPQNIKALKRVLAFYNLKNVKVIEKALGDKNGEAEMVMPVLEEVKMQGLSHVMHHSITDFNEGKKYTIPIGRLDDCEALKAESGPVTAVKLDVENFEYYVLKGGAETLAEHRPLVYTELWENENRQRCFDLLSSMGYRTEVLVNQKLITYDPAKHRTQNFFFIPQTASEA